MSFILGTRSRQRLAGVHPKLVAVVERAILVTTRDFAVHEGLRTVERQRAYVAAGTSWTLNSKHLRQPDGYAHAIDLVPFIDGKLQWDWEGCYRIAATMCAAATAEGVRLRWGGAWDRLLNAYASSPEAAEAASRNYAERRRRLGKRVALDGPHYEIAS